MELQVAFLGFGNVGRALAELLRVKQETLRSNFDLHVHVVGISTGRHGQAIDTSGIDITTALDAVRLGSRLDGLHQGRELPDQQAFIDQCPADLVFESIPTNPTDGQPALDYTRQLLGRGLHVVSANKGPVVFAYRELRALAAGKGVGYFFESSVMDGAPIFSAWREGLLAAGITRVRGIFNSTTNYILTRMEADGISFDEAVRAAQQIGMAETDPTLDVDGWDSAIKTAILANVLMGVQLKPADAAPRGIRDITSEDLKAAAAAGERIKLVCEVNRHDNGAVTISVGPQRLPLSDAMANVSGTSNIIDFHTDVLPRLTMIENDPSPVTTAFGMMTDMISVVRKRYPIEGQAE